MFAGQYEDAESGWAYNRFRYYNPTLGGYNAQDPLGLAPRLASAQGYVDHAAFWIDFLGLESCPEFVEGIPVKRYGSTPVGGHHIPAKANYNNAPLARQHSLDAPAVPINELKNSNNPATGSALHKEITAAQRRGYDDIAKNFDPDVDTYT